MALVLISTIEDSANGIILEVWAEDNGSGGVNFEIKSVGTNTADYDLNGFFVDVGDDGGTLTSIGGKANNMIGSSADGTKLDGFDYGAALGSVGGNDTDWNSGTFTIDGLNFEDLDGAQLGLRLTSVGPSGTSLKLVGDAEIPDEPPEESNFPELDKDISNVVLYFQTTEGDVKPSPDGDGYYTVKIDNVAEEASDDFDDWLADVQTYLIANDPNVADAELVGVAIKYGSEQSGGGTEFYAMDNDPDIDTAPAGTTFPLPGNEVDKTYQYGEVYV